MKILLADDDELILKVIENTLTKNGHEVTTASDGAEAVEKAMESHKYDLIITDILMPEIEGIEVIAEIIEKWPKTRIIAISSEGDSGHMDFLKLAETVGASASLKKPFTPAQLLETINNLNIKVA